MSVAVNRKQELEILFFFFWQRQVEFRISDSPPGVILFYKAIVGLPGMVFLGQGFQT